MRSEMEQQRLDLQKTHSTELEKMLEKVSQPFLFPDLRCQFLLNEKHSQFYVDMNLLLFLDERPPEGH